MSDDYETHAAEKFEAHIRGYDADLSTRICGCILFAMGFLIVGIAIYLSQVPA